jgi:type II secretory pathway pseudopilin PulG
MPLSSRMTRRPIVHSVDSRRRAGFTLIEALITASMVLSGVLVITSTALRSRIGRVAAEQQASALAALEETAARLRALDCNGAWVTYAPAPTGAPFPAAGSGPGLPIAAPGLCDAADPTKPALVVIRFFTDETAFVPSLGLPRDLDGDGATLTTDTTQLGADGQIVARLLPYSLSITFRGPQGGTVTKSLQGAVTHVR